LFFLFFKTPSVNQKLGRSAKNWNRSEELIKILAPPDRNSKTRPLDSKSKSLPLNHDKIVEKFHRPIGACLEGIKFHRKLRLATVHYLDLFGLAEHFSRNHINRNMHHVKNWISLTFNSDRKCCIGGTTTNSTFRDAHVLFPI